MAVPDEANAHHPSRWLAYGSLALSMTLVGSYVALSKPLVAALGVFLLAWLRFGIGGLAMARPPMPNRNQARRKTPSAATRGLDNAT